MSNGNDQRQFETAINNWRELQDNGFYSVPRNVGTAAIMCSYADVHHSIIEIDGEQQKIEKSYISHLKDIRVFRNEAFALAKSVENHGQSSEVILNANSADMKVVLTDHKISDVVLIGHGALSHIFMDIPDTSDIYVWDDVARDADHLKQGYFIQRFCGLAGRRMSVPLGAFAVSDHRNVYAPINRYFAPRGLEHHHNDRLIPVSADQEITYNYVINDIKAINKNLPGGNFS